MEFNKDVIQLKRMLRSDGFRKELKEFNLVESNGSSKNHATIHLLETLFNSSEENLRILTYYLILNSSKNEDLLDDHNVGLFVDQEYLLPDRWVVYAIEKLNLHKYFKEATQYGPSGITLPLLKIWLGCYVKRSEHSFTHVLNYLQAVWYRINTLSVVPAILPEIFNSLSLITSNICAESAEASFIFNFLLFVCEELNCPCQNDLKDLYSLSQQYCCMENSASIIVVRKRCLESLMNDVGGALKIVTCDIWISWSESNFPDSPVSIQTTIGNTIHSLLLKVKAIDLAVPSDVLLCLNYMKIEPLSIEDKINGSNLEEIIDKVKIEKSPAAEKWYDALFNSAEACNSHEALSALLAFLYLSHEPQRVLIQCLESIITLKDSKLKEEFLETLQTAEIADQLIILQSIYNNQNWVKFFKNNNCQLDVIETFNKITKLSDVDQVFKYLIVLLVQNPKNVIFELFQMAIASPENHDLCRRILKKVSFLLKNTEQKGTENERTNLASETMRSVLRNKLTDKQSLNLLRFLSILADSSVFSWTLIEDAMIENLEESVQISDWSGCKTSIQILSSAFSSPDYRPNGSLMLTFLAFLLGKTSWDWDSFEAEKCELHELVAAAVSHLKVGEITDLERRWARYRTSELPLSSTAFFSMLWQPEDFGVRCELHLLRRVRCWGLPPSNQSEQLESALRKNGRIPLIIAVIKILPILLRNEWTFLYTLLCMEILPDCNGNKIVTAFNVLSEALVALSLCVTETSLDCYLYCVTNFSAIFLLATSQLTNSSLQEMTCIFKSFLRPFTRLQSLECQNRCYIVVMPHLVRCTQEFLLIGNSLDPNRLKPILESLTERWKDDFLNYLKRHFGEDVKALLKS